ncbi:MAG: hypothetical protein Q8J63_03605 [Candidatus Aquicultor sp.]|nr:hypothetical protein [Candidatus Aquicultor sp.]
MYNEKAGFRRVESEPALGDKVRLCIARGELAFSGKIGLVTDEI